MWDLRRGLARLWSFCFRSPGTLSPEGERDPETPVILAILHPSWDARHMSEPNSTTWNRDEIVSAASVANCWPTYLKTNFYFKALSFGNSLMFQWLGLCFYLGCGLVSDLRIKIPLLLLLLLSRFSRVRLCANPQMAAHQAPHPWDSPGKNTGVGCHFLLQLRSHKPSQKKKQRKEKSFCLVVVSYTVRDKCLLSKWILLHLCLPSTFLLISPSNDFNFSSLGPLKNISFVITYSVQSICYY